MQLNSSKNKPAKKRINSLHTVQKRTRAKANPNKNQNLNPLPKGAGGKC